MLYPVFLKIQNLSCVVAGGGRVAERKVKQLLQAGAKVTVISPEITPLLQNMNSKGDIVYKSRPVTADDFDHALLVIAATNDSKVNYTVYKWASARNLLVNVVDVPELCNFYVPGIVRRGDLTVAVSTHGQAPALARRIRMLLEKILPSGLAGEVKRLAQLRHNNKQKKTDSKQRSRLAHQEADKVMKKYFNGL